MLHNVYVDLVGNFSLVFVWYGEEFHNVFWLLVGEDPRNGQPFTVCGGPCRDLEQCAVAAWKYLIASDWFVVQSPFEGLPPIGDVWRRAFGPNFAHVVKSIQDDKVEIPGVVYIKYLKAADAMRAASKK